MRALNNNSTRPARNRDRAVILLVVICVGLGLLFGAGLIWAFFISQPLAPPTATALPPTPTVASTSTSALPTLPPEWTATPFPTRAGTAATVAVVNPPGATETPPPVGPASSATPTPTLAAPVIPTIGSTGYPGQATPISPTSSPASPAYP